MDGSDELRNLEPDEAEARWRRGAQGGACQFSKGFFCCVSVGVDRDEALAAEDLLAVIASRRAPVLVLGMETRRLTGPPVELLAETKRDDGLADCVPVLLPVVVL
mmetsp:Transcript_46927/g.101063  ORF Transcript_46927/g.101063 Transcript_46927/m.101063 type:complete len:105 (-) Transcript_46927:315-629(-)